MSDLLSIGASGLNAYRRALGTIGDNIANAQTPGYARRTLATREMTASGDTPLIRAHIRPAGVEIVGTQRSTDQWLIASDRIASGESARSSQRLDSQLRVETILGNDANGISDALTGVFNHADALTAEPGNNEFRRQFLGAVDDVARGFRTTGKELARLADDLLVAAQREVDGLNADLQPLAKVNLGLSKARPGSTGEASLLDQRDQLLDQLAAKLDITIAEGAHGTVQVRAAGSGDLLLSGTSVQRLNLVGDADGRLTLLSGTTIIHANSGSLAGFIESANDVADQRRSVDRAATSIRNSLDTAHVQGFDRTGTPGVPLFHPATDAASLAAVSLDPAQVAAADLARDNGNMLAFAQLRGAGGLEEMWSELLAGQGQITASARAQHSAASARSEAASTSRQQVSEVDLDREAAELIRFQQAYTAAAQTIQVARDTMQALFNAI